MSRPQYEHLRLQDRIQAGCRALFVGINPGVRSALTGHHFAGYSNRFWKLLHEAKLVPEALTYEDDVRMPRWGFGVTNLIARPSPGIDTLKPQEYAKARHALEEKVARFRPAVIALVGVTLYRFLFPASAKQPIRLGLQKEQLAGVPVFVLPNPSGRNANFSHEEMLEAFRALHRYLRSLP